MSLFKKFFLIILLWTYAPLFSDQTVADNAVTEFFQPLPIKQVTTTPFFANLFNFEVKFTEPALASVVGWVDENGLYLINGSKVITDPDQIAQLLLNSTPLEPESSFGEFNLNAYLLNGKNAQTLWIDNQNRYAVVGGQVVDLATFTNINFFYNDFLSSESRQNQANYLYQNRKSYGSFLQGNKNAPQTMYVLGDPNCKFCNALYLDAKPFVEAGQLSIHWAMFTLISTDSLYKSAAIYQAEVPPPEPHTPTGALDYNEENFSSVDESGGIPPAKHIKKKTGAILSRIQQFIYVNCFLASPFIIFKNSNGLSDYQIGYDPGSIDSLLSNIFNTDNP